MDKTWVYGGLRVADGQAVTCTAASRNSVNYQRFLELVEAANPASDILVITDNLSSHTSVATRPGWPTTRASGRCSSQGRLLAESARGMVAAVSPPGAGRPMLRRRRRDHPGHQGRDPPAQCPRPPLGVGPTTTIPTPPPTGLHLPPLRNAALEDHQADDL